jgi:NitT/TauT family transport system substrate-binding protein
MLAAKGELLMMLRAFACLAAALTMIHGASAEHIRIGSQKVASPLYIGVEKGYFAAEGFEPELVYFEAGQPVAVAAVSGDIDFGVAGLTGGLYALAEQGALTLIGGQTREVPGFRSNTIVASKKAWDGGLKGFKDLAGHSVAVTQIGSSFHYDLALLADKYHFDLKSIRILPLQSNPNSVAAVSGGSADAAVTIFTYVKPALDKGDVKLLGYMGDEVAWQLTGVFTSTKIANERADTVRRYLRAFRKSARDYYDAFTAPDGTRRNGPDAAAILAIMAKYTGQSVSQIDDGIAYVDPNLAIDAEDVGRQVEWYKAQGLLKGDVPGEKLVDARYATLLKPSASH